MKFSYGSNVPSNYSNTFILNILTNVLTNVQRIGISNSIFNNILKHVYIVCICIHGTLCIQCTVYNVYNVLCTMYNVHVCALYVHGCTHVKYNNNKSHMRICDVEVMRGTSPPPPPQWLYRRTPTSGLSLALGFKVHAILATLQVKLTVYKCKASVRRSDSILVLRITIAVTT